MKPLDRTDGDGGCGDVRRDCVELLLLFVGVGGNLRQFLFLREKFSYLLGKGGDFFNLPRKEAASDSRAPVSF